jgi:ribosome maturation factor RimP
MNEIKENILKLSTEIVQKLNFLLVDFNIRGDQRKRIIEVYVDCEKTVSADDLAEISREINSAIEEKNLIDKSYRLDVSTPGVDRPLKFLQQFPKHVNRNFEIIIKNKDEEQILTGKLLAVKGEDLHFNINGKELIVKFNNTINAKVLISFS